MRYRKKPVVIEASQWVYHGDHASVEPYIPTGICQFCPTCLKHIGLHGFVKTPEGGFIVCPGDWIITDDNGEHYSCKPDIFDKTYEKVN